MKKLLMSIVTVSSLTLATVPAFAAKAPATAAKVPVASTNLKDKTMKIAPKQALKNKGAVVGIKRAK